MAELKSLKEYNKTYENINKCFYFAIFDLPKGHFFSGAGNFLPNFFFFIFSSERDSWEWNNIRANSLKIEEILKVKMKLDFYQAETK